jgi:hypothetical protein
VAAQHAGAVAQREMQAQAAGASLAACCRTVAYYYYGVIVPVSSRTPAAAANRKDDWEALLRLSFAPSCGAHKKAACSSAG